MKKGWSHILEEGRSFLEAKCCTSHAEDPAVVCGSSWCGARGARLLPKSSLSLSARQARPLTRYLPIRKEDFDLRSHIESSGHSVDTCSHIILSEKMCRGYLVKMGGKIKSWKKRWFVFDRLRRTLSYYVGMVLMQ